MFAGSDAGGVCGRVFSWCFEKRRRLQFGELAQGVFGTKGALPVLDFLLHLAFNFSRGFDRDGVADAGGLMRGEIFVNPHGGPP
jgi:hypothetical protein